MFLFSLMINSLAGLLAMAPVMVLYQMILWRKAKELLVPFSPVHTGGTVLFSFLIIGILSVTGIPSVYRMEWHPEYNFAPLMDITVSPVPYLLNVVLFLPLGFVLPMLWKCFQKPGKTIVHGFLFSLMIELMQLFNYRATDIDDLLMNTAGTVLGYMVFLLVRKSTPKMVFTLRGGQASASPSQCYWCFAISWVSMLLFQPLLADWMWSLYYA